MIAYVFPGQGSQKAGMGAELAEGSRAARDVFAEVDEALGHNLFRLMREGPADELTLTENAQPAIMAHSLAVWRVAETEFDLSIADAHCVAGHSLGEYSALAAAGAFSLADTARLLRLRGRAMQEAVPVGEGTMCALLGADLNAAERLAEASAGGEVCVVANDNDPSQVVLSGHVAAIDRAIGSAKEHGAKRAVKLPVSAPFHCPLMRPAAEAMEQALSESPPAAFVTALYANVTAAPVTDPRKEQRLLVEQVTGRVRWRESVLAMRKAGVERFVEVGGKVLGPMIARTAKDAQTVALTDMASIEGWAKKD